MLAIRNNIKKGTFERFHKKYINKLWYLLNIDYLLKKNISNEIIIKGFGENQTLINTNDGIEEKKNRRTEIIFK